MGKLADLLTHLQQQCADYIVSSEIAHKQLTVETTPTHLYSFCQQLRDNSDFQFNVLIDVCGVDYLRYGIAEWATEEATGSGYERGTIRESEGKRVLAWDKPRFAVAYHLLSTTLNHRLRLKVFVPEELLVVSSVVDIWASANWFEREAFDMFGILFEGHPDLRRILTDYGFVGHPFRKDFPLSGHVEMRYDATLARVVYEPVDIEPRVLVPKVIRDDNRYQRTTNAREDTKHA
ncbi:MAG: NADH-quinone oxidoreductase subunit C [Gammaproteobacteria bacterium]